MTPPRSVCKHDRQSAMHRALLLTEVLCLIFEYVREWGDGLDDLDVSWSNMDRATLASLARTCRAFHEPALDALWMKLDALEPLFELILCGMRRRCSLLPVRPMLMKEKHWITFRKYTSRVKSVRFPCWRAPYSMQHGVIRALAKFPKAYLPLLPNLMEILWGSLYGIDPPTSLLKYFLGPGITKVSLSITSFHVSSGILSDLSNLCPNVTSFTVLSDSHTCPTQEISDLVNRWTKLRTCHNWALPQAIMDQLAKRQSLESLSIELRGLPSHPYVGRFSKTLHQFSLGGNDARTCKRYLEGIQCSPESCRLRVGANGSTVEDMAELFLALPAHLNKTALRSIMIVLTNYYWTDSSSKTFRLDITLMTPFLVFRSLTAIDLDIFSSAGLDDEAYDVMAKTWPNLRSLALGTRDVSRAKPLATMNALVSLVTRCPNLQTLHFAFDGSVPPPSEIPHDVQNKLITQLQVGHSPIGDVHEIALCLGRLMPRLKSIVSAKKPLYNVAKWADVQQMLRSPLHSQCIGTE